MNALGPVYIRIVSIVNQLTTMEIAIYQIKTSMMQAVNCRKGCMISFIMKEI